MCIVYVCVCLCRRVLWPCVCGFYFSSSVYSTPVHFHSPYGGHILWYAYAAICLLILNCGSCRQRFIIYVISCFHFLIRLPPSLLFDDGINYCVSSIHISVAWMLAFNRDNEERMENKLHEEIMTSIIFYRIFDWSLISHQIDDLNWSCQFDQFSIDQLWFGL